MDAIHTEVRLKTDLERAAESIDRMVVAFKRCPTDARGAEVQKAMTKYRTAFILEAAKSATKFEEEIGL